MKKYIYLKEGDIIQEGDELKGLNGWLSIDAADYAGTSVRYSEEKMESFRRPVPHTGDVQFLMCMSPIVPIVVNCDGKTQEEIENEAGRLLVEKILANPHEYILFDNIEWGECKVDEIQPEPKSPASTGCWKWGTLFNQMTNIYFQKDGSWFRL